MNVPRHVRRAIERAGGFNRYGQPNYRVMWSDDRLDWQGGAWDEYVLNGKTVTQSHGINAPTGGIFLRTVVDYRQLPKYWTHPQRWVFEKWMPPETYGTMLDWYRQTREVIFGQEIMRLGPFPEQGEYEFSWVGEDPQGNFINLTQEIVSRLIGMIRAGQNTSRSERLAALWKREEKKEEATRKFFDDVVSDAMLPFHGRRGEIVLTDNLKPLSKPN